MCVCVWGGGGGGGLDYVTIDSGKEMQRNTGGTQYHSSWQREVTFS